MIIAVLQFLPLAAVIVAAGSVLIMGQICQIYQVEARRRFLDPDARLVIAMIFSALAIVYFSG